MTIEIRELIIEARVSEPVVKKNARVIDDINQEKLIQKIVQQVLLQLHDEIRGLK
ncbi:TPA: hypothetical protein SLG40_003844 [Serratia odorifera]|nr:hypothetical protein [Serratia odorifera]